MKAPTRTTPSGRRARRPAPEHHRRRRRPPADRATRTGRSGRSSTARSTTSASCASAARRAGTGSRPASTPRCSSTSTRNTATTLVHALEGMFAFALWDARRAAASARPRPLRREAALLRGARRRARRSPPSSTRCSPGLGAERELDPASVDEYFVFGYVPGPRARSSRASSSSRPGHLLRLGRRSQRVRRRAATGAARRLGGAELRRGLRRARRPRPVGCSSAPCASRLVADVPLGVFLSGGLDSTLIAALAAQGVDAGRSRRSPSATTPAAVSEASSARRTARSSGREHHELVLTQARACAARSRRCSPAWTSRWPTRPSSRCMRSPSSRGAR